MSNVVLFIAMSLDGYIASPDGTVDYCWHSWELQRDSMRKLAQFSFEWILPGHGQRVRLPSGTMFEQMAQLVDRM